jgi:hypothetical protein
VVFGFASATIVAATIRTCLLYRNSQVKDIHSFKLYVGFWSAVELTTGMTATCLYVLGSLISSTPRFTQNIRHIEHHTTMPEPSAHPPYHANSSSQTVIYRPNTAYTPVMRYHDNISNLDFDIETPATRTRTHTMRSRATRNTQSRPASTWSQFSGFTYYTNPAESTIELNHQVSRRISAHELESIVQSLGLGRFDSSGPNIALTVKPLNGASLHDPGDGGDPADSKAHRK